MVDVSHSGDAFRGSDLQKAGSISSQNTEVYEKVPSLNQVSTWKSSAQAA